MAFKIYKLYLSRFWDCSSSNMCYIYQEKWKLNLRVLDTISKWLLYHLPVLKKLWLFANKKEIWEFLVYLLPFCGSFLFYWNVQDPLLQNGWCVCINFMDENYSHVMKFCLQVFILVSGTLVADKSPVSQIFLYWNQ